MNAYNIEYRKKHPQEYHQQRVNAGKASAKKSGGWANFHKLKEKNPELYHLICHQRAKKAVAVQRRLKKGVVFDPSFNKFKSKWAKMAAESCKRKKVGFFDPTHKVAKIAGKRSVAIQRKNKIGLFDPSKRIQKVGIKAAVEAHRKRGTGFFDPTRWIQKLGNKASKKAWRKGLPYWFMGVPFDSNQEREVAKWLNVKYGFIPKEGINCHVRLDGGEIDFRLGDIFIEYHPWDTAGRKIEQYFLDRRKLLDENGYKNYPLIVIDSLEELNINLFRKINMTVKTWKPES